jgi:CRISPR/Cas system-associated exonuclease Cas4 (RecB family)
MKINELQKSRGKMAKRKYNNEFPSVTQVLDELRKPGLEWWFKKNLPDFIEAEGKRSKEIGTQTHEVIQGYIETGVAKVDTQYPEEITNTLKSFMLFRQEHPNVLLKKSEIQLTSEKYKFNGTIDCIAEVDGKMVVADWKTGKAKEESSPAIFPEHKYQVSAYVYLYNEALKEKVDLAIIVTLAKDKIGYDWYVLDKKEIRSHFKNVFLPALQICNYKKKNEYN